MHVDIDSLRHFIERWLSKANCTLEQSDSPFVDRFVFTYISFNALYTAAANIADGRAQAISSWSYLKGGPPRRSFRRYPTELKRATQLVIEKIGVQRVGAILAEVQAATEQLCACIDSGEFYLHETADGAPDNEKDRQLTLKARNGDGISLLTIVYFLRCNLFHGSKTLMPSQAAPLSAATEVLQALIPTLLERVEAAARLTKTY